jgi:hypothetical protein
MMFAIALSFGAQTADAQLMCRVKARCATAAKKCCTPKLKLRTCCKAEEEKAEEEKTAKTCCKVLKLKLRTACCKAEEPEAKTACAPKNPCGLLSRMMTKLKSMVNTDCGCSGCEATPASGEAIPPAPEATKKTT